MLQPKDIQLMRNLPKSILLALLTITAIAQIPAPQINLGGNIGAQGFPVLNSGIIQFTSDANRNMTVQETSATGGIKVTSTVSLTATRNLVLPAGNFQFIAVENATTGGQSIQVIGQSGTGVTIANGASATVWFDGTNVVQTGSSGSGALFPSTNNIVFNTSTTAARNATVSDVGTLLSPLYTSTNYGFGDSTLDGVGCDVYANCFFGLLSAAHGGPSVNLGFGGQMASWTVVSMAINLNPTFNTVFPQYSILDDIGINDAAGCGGTNALCQQNYSAEQNAAAAIGELTGSTYQTLAPACTLTGTWASDTTSFAGGIYIGKTSTTNGDSMSCSITTTGNPIALEYVVHNGDAGTANCRVDSGSYQNINFFPYITLNNPVFTIFRSAEIAASAGTHTLNCIVTSATSASNPVEFIAVDSVPVGQTSTLPLMVMTNVISAGGTNDTQSKNISDLVMPIVTAYRAEGANIVYSDIRTPTNFPSMFSNTQTGCPTNTLNSSGGLHPNDCGHAAITKAIMTAAPNIYQTNMGAKTQGVQPGPFQSFGGFPCVKFQNGSCQSGGNYGSFTTTGINVGGWCVFSNNCLLFAFTGNQVVPGYAANTPVVLLASQGGPVCFGETASSMTLNSQLLPFHTCTSSNGDLYQFFPIGPSGTPVSAYFHPGNISRDNTATSVGNTFPAALADVTFLGPFTTARTYALGGCKSAVAGPENVQYTLYRHGTDGNSVTFVSSTGNGDNINGGSTGNSFIWTATEGDELTLQCSAAGVGGSYWTASVATTDASAITAGTLADARLSSNIPLLNASNTFTGTSNIFGSASGSVLLGASGIGIGTGQTATSSTNFNSPSLQFTGNFWTGTVSSQDLWQTQDLLGSGTNPTSTLNFTHSGSPGAATVSMPALKITGPGIPIATGTTSNTDLAGQITLSTGAGSYTFTATYATAPIVVCTDTTALVPVKCSASTTAITITGTASDVINYIVVGRT
jgi:hypothetical protein